MKDPYFPDVGYTKKKVLENKTPELQQRQVEPLVEMLSPLAPRPGPRGSQPGPRGLRRGLRPGPRGSQPGPRGLGPERWGPASGQGLLRWQATELQKVPTRRSRLDWERAAMNQPGGPG